MKQETKMRKTTLRDRGGGASDSGGEGCQAAHKRADLRNDRSQVNLSKRHARLYG